MDASRIITRVRFSPGLALAAALSSALAVPAARAASPSDPGEDLRHFATLHVGPSSASAAGMVLSCGRAAMTLQSGSVTAIYAGTEVVGVYFEGAGALEYRGEDPVEFPVAEHLNRKTGGLNLEKTAKAIVFRDRFDRLTWIASGRPLPELTGTPGPSLEASFAKSAEKFDRVRGAPVSHLFTVQRRSSSPISKAGARISATSSTVSRIAPRA
jgi:hypothetical protein